MRIFASADDNNLFVYYVLCFAVIAVVASVAAVAIILFRIEIPEAFRSPLREYATALSIF